MTRWLPIIPRPWSKSDLENAVNDALRVLAEIGIECVHEETRSRLADFGGVSFKGDRICFTETTVRGHLEKRRVPPAEPPSNEPVSFTLGGAYAALNYCDPVTGDIRPGTTKEAVQMARLWNARGNTGVLPLMPGDVRPDLMTLAAERISLENSRELGGSLVVTDPGQVPFLIEMNAVIGRRYRLVEQVSISPLKLNADGLETALRYAQNPDLDVMLDGFIPMAGATCPLDPRAAVVQTVAETLAYDMVCTVLEIPGAGLTIRVEPFDFQYAAIVFGSPEWCLYRTLAVQMSEYLTGRVQRTGKLRSVAKKPDAQAANERTASVLWQALLGARHFTGVGQLSIDEVFSPQQAVFDKDIVSYAERLIRGIDFDEGPADPVALIAEGVAENGYVGIDDTITRFRSFCRSPQFFRHWNLGRWKSEGEPSILADAWAYAQEEIASSTYELEGAQLKEIDAIYRRAEEYVRG